MPMEPGDKKTHVNFWYFVAAVGLILLLQQFWQTSQQVETISYSEFRQLLADGRIAEIAVSDTSIRGTLNSPLPGGQRYIYTVRVDPEFAAELAQVRCRVHRRDREQPRRLDPVVDPAHA